MNGDVLAPGPSVVLPDEPNFGRNMGTKRRPHTPAARSATSEEKHLPLPSCGTSCRQKCTKKISESHRADTHEQYRRNPYDTRCMRLNSHIVRVNVQRRRTAAPAGGHNRKPRELSYLYKLPNEDGTDVFVCKTFFHTLV